MYDDSAPNYCTVTIWFNEFKRGRQSLKDYPLSGRPADAVNAISVAAVEKQIVVNQRVKVSDVVKELKIVAGSVKNTIHKHLHVSKVSSCLVPRNLSLHDRHQYVASY